jgi:PE family
MTSLITEPQLMSAAAADVASAMTATLFGGPGQEYQALLLRASAFHEQFVAALAAAGNA